MRTPKNAAAFLLIVSIIVSLCVPQRSWADADKQEYYRSRDYFEKFLKDPEKKKYRDNWMACIQKFQSAYRTNPTGDYAAANLYMSGKIYQDLYALSQKSSDRKESIDIFNRLINRHPKSRYRSKAQAALKEFGPGDAPQEKKSADRPQASNTIKKKSAPSSKKSDATVLPQAQSIGKAAPSGENDSPPSGLGGRVEGSVYLKQRDKTFKQAKAAYKGSVQRKTDEKQAEGAHADDPISRLIVIEETCDPAAFTSPPMAPAPARDDSPTVISGLRFWSNPSYTRIVIDGSRETPYTPKLLKQDLAANKPQRLYIDFKNSRLDRNLKKIIPIDDDLLLGARAGQCTPDDVRVVIDIKSFKTYKVFSLKNPFRTIIDVWGKDLGNTSATLATKKKQTPQRRKKRSAAPEPRVYEAAVRDDPSITPNDLAKQFALGVQRIVIDAGHGGHDGGAPGYVKGVREKDVVLSIARRLSKKIRKELGCEVIMTRNSDRFLTLEERTAIANTKNADLFISIHCNASKNKRAYGIETYYLNLATDDDAILVAARENATSRKTISDLQNILNDLMQNSKINESSRLATYVQKSLHSHMKKNYKYVSNKGVKRAPFYVLLGAQMPAVLVETSFISNERECKRLMSADYQEDLCNAIIKGVRGYIHETNPTAFWNPNPGKKS